MHHRRLGKTDLQVSVLGFGAATLGEEYGPLDPAVGSRAVHRAIDLGVNFIDVAPYYGRTLAEERLGVALHGKRDRVILATKACRDGHRRFDFSAQRVRDSLDESLRRLRTDHVDLLHIHDVEYGHAEQVVTEALPAARELQRAGKTRFVGITGLPVGHLQRLAAHAEVDVILSYANHDLLCDLLGRDLLPFCQQRDIGLINASPLHLGVLTDQGPPAWHLADPDVLAVGRQIAELCRRRGRSVAQVALRYSLDEPGVATTLVGMRTATEVEENLAVLEQRSDPELLTEIEALVAPVKNRLWYEGLAENR